MKLCLLFPREALSVPVARRLLGDALRGLGAEDQGVADLLLAVTEACTNVVRHASGSTRYEVVACVRKDDCQVEVVDRGTGPDASRQPSWLRRPGRPLAIPPPRLPGRNVRPTSPGLAWLRGGRPGVAPPWSVSVPDESTPGLREGGRGLAIMRACVDDVTLSSRQQGTVVSLHKRMQWRAGRPDGWDQSEYASAG